MTPKEQMQTMLLENMQRSDLNPYEQAQGFQMMLDLGATVEEIAEKTGFSKKTVRSRVKMTELDQEKLKAVEALERIRPYKPNVVKAAWNIFGKSYEYRQKYNQYKEARMRDERKKKEELPGQIELHEALFSDNGI